MTDKVTVKTNHVPRLLLNGDQLTPKEREEFDYLSDEEMIGRDFVRYRGWVYDLGDMMAVTQLDREHCQRTDWMSGWDCYASDSFFSGVLFKYVDDDHVICATYFC